MFDPTAPDPLGVGLMQRAGDRARSQRVAADMANLSGWASRPIQTVLPDPQWQGWFQSLHENGIDNLGDSSEMERKGLWDPANAPYSPTFDPASQTSAVATAAPVVDKHGSHYETQLRPDANIAAEPESLMELKKAARKPLEVTR